MSAFPGVSSYQSSFPSSKFVVIGVVCCQEMRHKALFHKVLPVLTKYFNGTLHKLRNTEHLALIITAKNISQTFVHGYVISQFHQKLSVQRIRTGNNRPLAKLGKAVKIADTSNQRKAKRETMPAVAIAFRENAKPFDKADGVFNKDTFP